MATQQIINIGSSPNDGLGDPLRTAFEKTNTNFSVLFGIAGVTGIANGTSNISIPLANSNIVMSVGNVANVVTVVANGMITAGNHVVTSYVNAGNVTASGTITANGTIQSLGGVTAVTVTASGNLVGGNLNVTNQMRASTLLLTGNVINAELNVTGNVVAAELTSVGGLSVAANTDIAGNVTGSYFIGNGSQLTGVTAAPANIFNIIDVTGSPLVIATSPNDTLAFTFGNNLSITGNAATRTVDFAFTESPTFTGTLSATTVIGDLKGSVFADDSSLIIDSVDNKIFTSGLESTGNIVAPFFLGNIIGNISGNLTVGGANTQVVFNDEGVANATAGFTFDKSSNAVVVTGNITAANLVTAGNIVANNLQVSGIQSVTTLTVSGDTLITGNLTVSGTTITANVSNVVITDPIVGLGRGANGDPLTSNDGLDRGVEMFYFTTSEQTAFMGYDNNLGKLLSATNVTIANSVVTVNQLGNILLGNVESQTVVSTANITGGNLVTAGLLSVGTTATATGNVTGGNIITAGLVSAGTTITATGNVAGGNITTAGLMSAGTTITATGNVAGGNIVTAGRVTATSNVAGGNITTAGRVDATGNITGGNLIAAGLLSISSITKTGTNAVGNIGATSSRFNTVFATSTSALYADLAEKYLADQAYAPGTVLVLGGDQEVTASTMQADSRVIGVVSSRPAFTMNDGLEHENAVHVALVGRVPCLITGTVSRGDMLVSADNGRACACATPAMGTVIGKALEDHDQGDGMIEIVIGRI